MRLGQLLEDLRLLGEPCSRPTHGVRLPVQVAYERNGYDAAAVGIKITVVGGGSTYTPELVEGFAARTGTLPVDELVLFDVVAERLEIVGGLAGRILRRRGWPGQLTITNDRDRALEGAEFIVVQLRVGGQAARLVDETLPLRFGCVGQETTGPGGFAKALRTVPVVLELAEEIARRAAPGAWLIDFTNPVGIVTQALLDEGHHAIGLCNVAIGFQHLFARILGVDAGSVELEHVGLNHLSWERAVRVDGTDRLPELLDGHLDAIATETELPAELIRTLGVIPSSYLRYYYLTDQVLAEERAGRSRAEEVMDIERRLLDSYRDLSLDEKPVLLTQRGGALYSEAAAQLIESLHTGRGDVQVVDVRNDGALSDLPDDAVVELPARIHRNGAELLSLPPLAPELLGLVQQAKAYERLAARASLSGERTAALKALLANPLVAQYSVAAPLLDALLEANRAHLPRFFPEHA
jgi:6-phospho-beta-glucosidase